MPNPLRRGRLALPGSPSVGSPRHPQRRAMGSYLGEPQRQIPCVTKDLAQINPTRPPHQILQPARRGHQPAQLGCRVIDRFDFGKSPAYPWYGVGHGCFHTRSKSSVVVMVASSDSVLAMTAAPYSVGMPATASWGTTDDLLRVWKQP